MPNDPILHLLGLARKAGRLELGEEPVGALCRARHARLILLASDAAPNTVRRAAHFGEVGNVLWLTLPRTKEELGFYLGRNSCAMLALSDAGLAASLVDKLAKADPTRYAPAAQQLSKKADKMLQRQREKRQHEKNLRQGKRKSSSPQKKLESSTVLSNTGKKSNYKPSERTTSFVSKSHNTKMVSGHSSGRTSTRSGFSTKSDHGGRKLTGKFRHNP